MCFNMHQKEPPVEDCMSKGTTHWGQDQQDDYICAVHLELRLNHTEEVDVKEWK